MRRALLAVAGAAAIAGSARAAAPDAPLRVDGGLLAPAAVDGAGVRVFKGVPYAAAPVGPLRWRAPEPVEAWSGVRRSDRFGASCMQPRPFHDIDPYAPGMGEDCLFLNVWTPARAGGERLPVMVWIHGGGFVAGSGSEPRHDGVALAKKGVVVVTLNYRLGVFGFLAHPELSRETGWGGSGDWGLMDQVAALQWVRRNIAAFGGDPAKVTIFGESAGSWSVSAMTASPLARGLFRGAIGESGAVFPSRRGAAMLSEAEAGGTALAASLHADTLADLRHASPGDLLEAHGDWRADVDGHVLPQAPERIFAEGRQNAVPMIAGYNSDEGGAFAGGVLAGATLDQALRDQFGARAATVRAAYPANTEEAKRLYGGDAVIAYPTWAWAQAMRETGGGARTWLYFFDRKPGALPGVRNRTSHADDIVYAFGHPDVRPDVAMTDTDRAIADALSDYWVAFAKTGDPAAAGRPAWPAYDPARGAAARMRFGDAPAVEPDGDLARYRVLDPIWRGAAVGGSAR